MRERVVYRMRGRAINWVGFACSCRIRVHSFVIFVLSHGNRVKRSFAPKNCMLYCTVYCDVLCCENSLPFIGTRCTLLHNERLTQNLHEWWKIANNISAVRQNYNDGPSPHSLIYDWSVRHQNRCYPIEFSVDGLIYIEIFFFFSSYFLIESVRQNHL